jgi:hypothetical protein
MKLTKVQLQTEAQRLGLKFNSKTTNSELESMIANARPETETPEPIEETGEY